MILLCLSVETGLSQDLSTYRWEHRLMLILSESPADTTALTLIDALRNEPADLLERRLQIYHLTSDVAHKMYPDHQRIDVPSAYAKYHRSGESFELLLIGLDGGIKMYETSMVDLQLIWDKIDSMPMRQSELRSGGGG